MAVKLRLMRMGKTKQPTYRVVASDARSPRNGRFIELLGTYDPRQEPSGINIHAEKTQKWLANGAQPTERVQKLLVASGVVAGDVASKTLVAKKHAKRMAARVAAGKAAANTVAPQSASSEPTSTALSAEDES